MCVGRSVRKIADVYFQVGAEFLYFKQKTAYEMRISGWSSDVCSSDLKTTERRAIAGLLVGRPLSRHAIVHLRTMDGLSCLRRGRCGLRRALHEECKTNTDKNKGTDERHPTTIILPLS